MLGCCAQVVVAEVVIVRLGKICHEEAKHSYKISPKERFGYNHPGYDHLYGVLNALGVQQDGVRLGAEQGAKDTRVGVCMYMCIYICVYIYIYIYIERERERKRERDR